MEIRLATNELVSRLACNEFIRLGVVLGFSKDSNLSYLGSGYEHQNSYYLLKNFNFKQPFTLVVYDMHDDYRESKEVSCGNWIYHFLKDFPECNAVIVGCTETRTMKKGNLTITNYKAITASDVLAYCKPKIYESVDLDVLKEKLALSRREWNYGQLSLDKLLFIMKDIQDKREVLGLDLCGHCECKKFDYNTVLISAIVINAFTKQASESKLLALKNL